MLSQAIWSGVRHTCQHEPRRWRGEQERYHIQTDIEGELELFGLYG